MSEAPHMLVEADSLSRRFPGGMALSSVSFSVAAGELVAVIGPNGAGKTTLLRLLAGLLAPTAGSARIDGRDVSGDSLSVRRISAFLPDDSPLYSEMRVCEYLRFRGRIHGLRGAHLALRIRTVLDQCGIADDSRRLIAQLSRGTRRRVALADCFLHSPSVLLLDEPLDGLDAAQAASICSLLIDMSADSAVLFSSHNLPLVERICPRVLVLRSGQLVADSSPADLVASQPGARSFEQAFIRLTRPLPPPVRRSRRRAAP